MIEQINKLLVIPTFVLALLALGLVLVGGNQHVVVQGDTNYDSLDVTDGYKVDGTTIIDGSGNLDGVITSDTGSVTTLTQGGSIYSTSTSGTVIPLLAAAFDVESVIDVTLNVSDATLSFPATSTLSSFIPTAGQFRTVYVRNASTTAAMDLTVSGGTGVLLKKATTTAIIYGDTDGANFARITLTRKANTDIEALLEIFVD